MLSLFFRDLEIMKETFSSSDESFVSWLGFMAYQIL